MVLRIGTRFISIILLVILASVGVIMVLRATPEGVTLSDDSIAYIAGARSMLAGQGYREAWLASNGPVTHLPPAYPAVLTFLGWFGLDPLRGARFLGAALFGLNAALLGILGWRMTRWLPAGLALSLLFVLNGALVRMHASALSEPLFILLSLLAFWAFDLYHERDAHWLWLVACGSLVGVAYLTRYAGLALVVTFLVALTVVHRTWRQRLARMGILLAAIAPWMGGWAMRNELVGGTATNRILVWHPITQSNLNTAWRTVAGIVWPVEAWRQAALRVDWLIPAILAVAFLAIGTWIVIRLREKQASNEPRRPEVLSLLNGLYIFGYVASILAAMFLFDASTKFKLRILAPAYVSVLVLVVALGAWAWRRRRNWVVVISALLVTLSAVGVANTMGELGRGAQGYASFRWYDSKAMAFLRLLPDDVSIYTNEPGAVYLYTGRPAYVLPDRTDPVTAEPRSGFERGLAELQSEVTSGRAVLALFSGGDLPAQDGAALSAGLALVEKSGGAEIYGAQP